MTRLVRCAGCPATGNPRLTAAGVEIDGLPEGWHGVTLTGTPLKSWLLCSRCTRRLLARLAFEMRTPLGASS